MVNSSTLLTNREIVSKLQEAVAAVSEVQLAIAGEKREAWGYEHILHGLVIDFLQFIPGPEASKLPNAEAVMALRARAKQVITEMGYGKEAEKA